jgi:hypothetical protein
VKVTAKMPPKMMFGNMNQQNIAKRQSGLQDYIFALLRDDNLGVNALVLISRKMPKCYHSSK